MPSPDHTENKPRKVRLDALLVERGCAPSPESAQRMIRAGQVWRGTNVADKPGLRLPEDAQLEVRRLHERFVGRGGWKLQAALDAFPSLTPCPEVCADIGASTGGFTDCLLQHGARKVYAIDVGRSQLHERLREDNRVVVMERTNARYLAAQDLPELVDLVVGDVSFISLEKILGPALAILKPQGGQAAMLVKPQFEADRKNVSKGGVVRDPAVHRDLLRRIALEVAPDCGLLPRGLIASPLRGPAGNREYMLWLTPAGEDRDETPIGAEQIDDAIAEAFAEPRD